MANGHKGKEDRHLANICNSFSEIIHLNLQRQKHQAFRKLSGYKGLGKKEEAAQTKSTRMKGILSCYQLSRGIWKGMVRVGVDNKGVNSLQSLNNNKTNSVDLFVFLPCTVRDEILFNSSADLCSALPTPWTLFHWCCSQFLRHGMAHNKYELQENMLRWEIRI